MSRPLKQRLAYASDSTYRLTPLEREVFERLLMNYHYGWQFIVHTEPGDRYEQHLDQKTSLARLFVGRDGLYRTVSEQRFVGSAESMRYYQDKYEALTRERTRG